jgi:23S rRNA (uridine2552-2'-O)-methyltransferase
VRVLHDHYFKKAKQQNYPARSVFKLAEIQTKHRFIKAGDKVVDLGCHPGSWTLFASETAGANGVVVGVDLKQTEHPPRPGGAPIHWLCHDIMDDTLVDELHTICPRFKVLLSDLAPKTTGNRWADHQQSMRLVRRTVALAERVLVPSGHYLGKLFQGEETEGFIKELRGIFSQVKVIKPDSSRKQSREVYALALRYSPNSIGNR